MRQTAGKSPNRPEHHGHAEDAGEREEVESKERSGSSSEIGEEVHGDVEEDRCQELVGKIAYHRGRCHTEWMVKSVLRLLFDDRTLGIQSEDLRG